MQDWMKVYLPLSESLDTNNSNFENDGWQLQLKQGWKIKESKRKGDYEVVKE